VDIRLSWVIVAVVALFGGAAVVARADEPAAVAGGETAPASSAELPSARALDGQNVSFADLLGGDGKAVCYTFLHPTCPLAQRYAPVLAELDKEFDEQGIHFVGVVCEFDDVDEITGYRDEYAIHFPFLTDRDFHLADALDATTTPEVVLVDASGRIRYQGRIDDRYKVRGEKSPGPPEPDLENAILDLLAGREVQLPVTEAVGCPLDRPEVPTTRPQPHHEITYAEDVLPFLHAQCQRCHSPGQAGPFTLTSYDDAVDWMEQAIEEIEARRMPPAQVESDFGLLGTKPPTAEQLAMLREWVKTDMPAGDPAKTPKLAPLPDYAREPNVIVDVITLDSSSCAPCQYMVESVKAVAPEFEGIVEWREHKIKYHESLVFMASLMVRNVPTICIDGQITFVSRIPGRDELIEAIQKRIYLLSKMPERKKKKISDNLKSRVSTSVGFWKNSKAWSRSR